MRVFEVRIALFVWVLTALFLFLSGCSDEEEGEDLDLRFSPKISDVSVNITNDLIGIEVIAIDDGGEEGLSYTFEYSGTHDYYFIDKNTNPAWLRNMGSSIGGSLNITVVDSENLSSKKTIHLIDYISVSTWDAYFPSTSDIFTPESDDISTPETDDHSTPNSNDITAPIISILASYRNLNNLIVRFDISDDKDNVDQISITADFDGNQIIPLEVFKYYIILKGVDENTEGSLSIEATDSDDFAGMIIYNLSSDLFPDFEHLEPLEVIPEFSLLDDTGIPSIENQLHEVELSCDFWQQSSQEYTCNNPHIKYLGNSFVFNRENTNDQEKTLYGEAICRSFGMTYKELSMTGNSYSSRYVADYFYSQFPYKFIHHLVSWNYFSPYYIHTLVCLDS